MSLKDELHNIFLEKQDKISAWFEEKLESKDYPFYCSFDIRESNFKLAPVDANLFPAGFNNICFADREVMGELVTKCTQLKNLTCENIGLFCEEHTNNPYYWDNVYAISKMLKDSGFKVFVLLPTLSPEIKSIESASGQQIKIESVEIKNGEVFVSSDEKVDFLLSNNDFSSAYESWVSQVKTPMLPPLGMGWHRRRKNSFFKIYNDLVKDFCEEIDLDPFLLQVETSRFDDFDLSDSNSIDSLIEETKKLKSDLQGKYKQREITDEPYLFVKNSYGTYGLGVMEVKDPEGIKNWNYKARKKMKATKGGKGVSSLIIQEGIPTVLKSDGASAEAVIYLVGCGLAGGFLRTHGKKDGQDSLNAPGAIFKRMCFSDYEFQKENKVLENVYGTVARIGALALSLEIKESLS